jgi:hypothetical protein
MAFMMNKLLVKFLLKNKYNFLAQYYFEIQVHTILVCALYSIKYGREFCCYIRSACCTHMAISKVEKSAQVLSC